MTISHSSMMPICHQSSGPSAIMQFIHDANLPPNPPPLPLPLCHHAIMSIIHHPLPLKNHAHLPSYLKAIMPISHLAPPPSANMPITHHLPLKNYAHQPSYLKAIMPISHHAPPPFSLSSKSATMIPPLPSPIIFIGHHANQPPCPYPLFHYSNQLSRAFNITNHLPS